MSCSNRGRHDSLRQRCWIAGRRIGDLPRHGGERFTCCRVKAVRARRLLLRLRRQSRAQNAAPFGGDTSRQVCEPGAYPDGVVKGPHGTEPAAGVPLA